MKNRFYFACFRDNVGENVSFHCHNGKGYSTDISKAHVCSLQEAQYAFDMAREFEIPVSADHVDELSVWKVDCQYLREVSHHSESGRYVAYKNRKWDGNDVYWVDGIGSSLDFSKAKIFDKIEEREGFAFITFEDADKVKRRTFSMNLLDKRKMVQGAGLKMPERLKKELRRKANPMERFNCPECGRINWQQHTYFFEGCSNYECGEWRLK